MQITTIHGDVDIVERDIIEFPRGIVGFESCTRFVLMPPDTDGEDEQTSAFLLQSVDEPELAFLALLPSLFYPDYEVDVPESYVDSLGLNHIDIDDVLVLNLVSTHRDADDTPTVTVNLIAPVVINSRARLGAQVVLADGSLPLRAPLPATQN